MICGKVCIDNMSDHLKVKHQLRKITLRDDFYKLLDSIMISKFEREIMEKVYLERITFQEIAAEYDYSEIGIRRIHSTVLEKLKPILLSDC